MANMYEAQAAQMRTMAYATQDVTLNCDQTGFGVTPIIGIDWKINDRWNLAAKYEFKTRIRLKNEAANSASAAGLSALNQFKDGKKIAEDIPAMLTLGVQYTPVKNVRLMAGHHYFYDKQASKYNHTEKKLSRGTCEFNAGAEVDVNKRLTLSAGWQNTNYGLTDEYMQDISFVTNSNSVGIGLNYRFSDRLSIDLSYFQTFFQRSFFNDYLPCRSRNGYSIGIFWRIERKQPLLAHQSSHRYRCYSGLLTIVLLSTYSHHRCQTY